MASAIAHKNLWSLVGGTPQVDARGLLTALRAELEHPPHDARTQLLIRDSYKALKSFIGERELRAKFPSTSLALIDELLSADLGDRGFPTLANRVMNATDPQTILQFLRELGTRIHQSVKIQIGGSTALILRELLRRQTDDIDAVDEVPASIRSEFTLLDDLANSYGLRLTHFQSHFLPDGWQSRVTQFGQFGKLEIDLISEWDITLGKLFSKRQKDRDDLRMLFRVLRKDDAIPRLQATAARLLAEPTLRAAAKSNWYVLFGEPLPA